MLPTRYVQSLETSSKIDARKLALVLVLHKKLHAFVHTKHLMNVVKVVTRDTKHLSRLIWSIK